MLQKVVAFTLGFDCLIREFISHCFTFLWYLTQDKSFREKCLCESSWIHAKWTIKNFSVPTSLKSSSWVIRLLCCQNPGFFFYSDFFLL